MRHIDMANWPRREHFQLFGGFAYPYFSMCANVDVTAFYPAVKARDASFTVATMYVLSRAANAIPEFRHRIREQRVVEHDVVHPSTTILTGDDLFSFCSVEYAEEFTLFAARASQQMSRVRQHPTLVDEPGRDDWLFMTAIPWVSFTAFMHPIPLNPASSVPRFAWGKFFNEGDALKMPLSIQGHHAVMDGIHVARCYELVQGLLEDPDATLGQP